MPDSLREMLANDREPLGETQWRAYFEMIAVPERRNPRLQAKCMPRRYWRNLVEKPGVSGMAQIRPGHEEGDVRGAC